MCESVIAHNKDENSMVHRRTLDLCYRYSAQYSALVLSIRIRDIDSSLSGLAGARIEDDISQPLDRFVDFLRCQQAERSPYVCRLATVRQENRARQRKDTTLDRVRADDALRVAFVRLRADQKLEPVVKKKKHTRVRGGSACNIRMSSLGPMGRGAADRAVASGYRNAPEEHAGLWRRPLCETAEVLAHRGLEHVALLAVEQGHGLGVRLEAVVAPCVEDGEGYRLR